MYERRHEKLLPVRAFAHRMLRHAAAAALVAAASLGLGVLGYHGLAGLPWVDALLNAAMILGGMGPVDALHGDGAKVFASAYALFSGTVFLVVMAIVLTPVLHRTLHAFHVENSREAKA